VAGNGQPPTLSTSADGQSTSADGQLPSADGQPSTHHADPARRHTLTPLKGTTFVVHSEDADVLSLFGPEADGHTSKAEPGPKTEPAPEPDELALTGTKRSPPTVVSASDQDMLRRRAESRPLPAPPGPKPKATLALPVQVATPIPGLPVAVPVPSLLPTTQKAGRQTPNDLTAARPAPLRVAAVGIAIALAALTVGLVQNQQSTRATEVTEEAEPAVSAVTMPGKAASPAPRPASSAADGATPSSRPLGWLLVEAPFELTVFEGNERVGTSHEARLPLATGRHALRFVNVPFKYEHDADLVVNTGQVTRTAPPIPNGTLQITAEPWADVWVDDIKAGRTPLNEVRVAIGRHAVRFEHPTLGSRVRIATVLADTPASVTADFR
jgi:hypothetical protein